MQHWPALTLMAFSFLVEPAQGSTCKPQGYANPKVKKSAKPAFPDIVTMFMGSKNATIAELCVEVLVEPLGRVAGIRYASGHSLLLDLAKEGWFDETVRQWRFEPKDQYPPGRKAYITFRFRLVPGLDDNKQELESDEWVAEVIAQRPVRWW